MEAGEYVISISGLVEAWFFDREGSKDNIIAVKNLGDVGWKNLERAFYGCKNLKTFYGGSVSEVTNMSYMLAASGFPLWM